MWLSQWGKGCRALAQLGGRPPQPGSLGWAGAAGLREGGLLIQPNNDETAPLSRGAKVAVTDSQNCGLINLIGCILSMI